MSGTALTVTVPPGTENLTPTERFEAILRTAPGVPADYRVPGVANQTRENPSVEQARYVERCRDSNGLVRSEEYVSCPAICYGYQLPAGIRIDPVETNIMLSVAQEAGIPANHVFKFFEVMGRRLGQIK